MNNNAILLISCPDRRGIVAAVSQFLYNHGANIIHADQHLDHELNLFFMRIEWSLDDFDIRLINFRKYFQPIALSYKMDWRLASTNYRSKIAIFVSKQDHCLADILYRYRRKEVNCEIKMIISNHNIAKDLTDYYNIPFFYLPVNSTNKKKHEKRILSLLNENKIDLIILARYMQIISPAIVKCFPNRIINIHHSFLPAFIGAKPYHQAYIRGVKIIGATSHFITEGLDSGPIIEQDVVRISHRDNVEDLIVKGRDLEKIVLFRAIRRQLENRILVYANRTVIFD